MYLQEHLAERLIIEENLYENPNYGENPDDIIINLDPSALKKSYCELALDLTINKGMKPLAMNEFLLFGKTVHKFAEWFSKGITEVPLVGGAVMPVMTYLVQDYVAQGGNDCGNLIAAMGQRAFAAIPPVYAPVEDFTEINVKIPFMRLTDKTTGKSILFKLCARMDHIYIDQWGTVIALDFKTSRKWDLQVVMAEYSHSIQFKFYYWLMRKFPARVFKAQYEHIVNAAKDGRVACQVCPVHLNKGGGKWILGPVLRYPNLVNEIDLYVRAHIISTAPIYLGMRSAFKNGQLSDSCGKCDFARLCGADSLVDQDRIKLTEYKIVTYDPEMF